MGFRFRRSITVVKGLRLNVSKSGYSWSFGGAPYTVNVSRRGTYSTFSIPSTGISYRERVGTPASPISRVIRQNVQADPRKPESYVKIEQVATSSDQMVADINERLARPQYALIGWIGAGATALALSTYPAVFLLTVAFVGLGLVLRSADRRRRTTQIVYEMDTEGQTRYLRLGVWLERLTHSQRTWLVQSSLSTKDWKRNAGASSLVTRGNVTLLREARPPFIESSLPVQAVQIGTATLFFLPDQILVHQGKRYAAVPYESLALHTNMVQFMETNGVPSDSHVVGTTWQYVRVDGGPDRRFNNNRQIPIALYVEVTLEAPSGLRVALQLSNSNLGPEIVQAFRAMQATM